MHSPDRIKIFTALLTLALLITSAPLRAQDGQQRTRPRRATAQAAEETPAPEPRVEQERSTGEPVVRIGLATNARSVVVSTTGRLLTTTEPGGAPTPLEVARVRVEPRTLPPINLPAEADPLEAIDSQAAAPAAAKATPQPTPKAGIQLTTRTSAPSRGEVLYAPGSAKPLLDARAPVLFASDAEEHHPVRYNEKAYRGRIEVFANTRGTLTVVNVVGLEDYVRGVVPNELSPGIWPELEALKAQAVAARTYAVGNLGRFGGEGFDLTPDTRSQVYGGRSTEHPLTDRAVYETRGRVITYAGRPINALYTSTCGGRTEDAENIFGGESVPYLRGRVCALEAHAHFAPFQLRSSRPAPDVKRPEHASSARDAALLTAHGFALPPRLTDEWLAASATADELRSFLGSAAALARQPLPLMGEDVARPGGFASALAAALDGESRGAALLSTPDIEYFLSFRDADEVPLKNRADVAAMLREGHLSLFPDATLRPRLPLARARALRSIAHALEARELFRLHKATAKPASNGSLVLRPPGNKGAERTLAVAPDAFLFRAFGDELYQQRELSVVGGEQLTFHTDAAGRADYLEVRPGPSGASADRFSVYASWAETLTPNGVLSRLGRSAQGVGTIQDIRVRRRGVSGRVLDLEVVGEGRTAHVRGGRVRSALGLREQLFVIDREYDEAGRVARFTFSGRGWGHGVGMCQVGAYGLARAGLSYDKILKSFYTGIGVSKLY